MDQMLKVMLGVYVGIILLAGIFGLSTRDSADDLPTVAQASLETASLDEKVKSADGDLQGHQPFNQVGFNINDKSSHKPLNIVRFDSEPHQAFNQVGFSISDKPKFEQSKSDDGVKHQAFNQVKFKLSDKPKFEQSESEAGVKHQAFNQVGFEKSSASSFGVSGSINLEDKSAHKPLNIVRFEKKD